MDEVLDGMRFFSDFDSGNLAEVSTVDPREQQRQTTPTSDGSQSGTRTPTTPVSRRSSGIAAPSSISQRLLAHPHSGAGDSASATYYLSVAPDCQGTSHENGHRSWFYFGVTFHGQDVLQAPPQRVRSTTTGSANSTPTKPTGGSGRIAESVVRHKVAFTIVNFSATNRIFDHDNRPVFCTAMPGKPMTKWDRLPQPLKIEIIDKHGNASSLPPACTSPLGVPSPTSPGTPMTNHSFFASGVAGNQNSPHVARKLNKAMYSSTMRITWTYTFTKPGETVFFAMNYPYSYQSLKDNLMQWEQQAMSTLPILPSATTKQEKGSSSSSTPLCGEDETATRQLKERIQAADENSVYFHREVLCYSCQNREVPMMTISGCNGVDTSATEPFFADGVPVRSRKDRCYLFPGKQEVLITARVHPGEVPASHVLHGFLHFILSADARAVLLRKHFVFRIVPMLNPDGVVKGHYRTDCNGINLNRMYDTPDIGRHPTIYATRQLFLAISQGDRLALYVDLHAHASKRGCFVFGNALDDKASHILNLTYPKLLSLNTPHFDFTSCDFTTRSMSVKNRKEGVTKEGTGRVALASETGLIHSYTLEVSYNAGVSLTSTVAQVDVPNDASLVNGRRTVSGSLGSGGRYSPETYYDVGRAIGISLLDLHGLNAYSRLGLTPFGGLAGVRGWIDKTIRQMHEEQQREDEVESHYAQKRKSKTERRRTMERVASTFSLPALNSYKHLPKAEPVRSPSATSSSLLRQCH